MGIGAFGIGLASKFATELQGGWCLDFRWPSSSAPIITICRRNFAALTPPEPLTVDAQFLSESSADCRRRRPSS